MSINAGKTGRPRRIWDAAGWFGAQIGSTGWIAICALLLSRHDPDISWIVLGIFLAANAVGGGLWFVQQRIPLLLGLRILVAIAGAAGMLAVGTIDLGGQWSVVANIGGHIEPVQMYALIPLGTLALLGLFWSIDRSRRQVEPG